MKCYICITKDGLVRDSVGVCKFCQVGLCLDHFIEVANVTQGGIRYTCNHALAAERPSLAAPSDSQLQARRR